MSALTPIELAERVAQIASALGIETALIGAYALAVHGYIRGTEDIDLASDVELAQLEQLRTAIEAAGFHTRLNEPDDEDPLGGKLVVWTRVDVDDEPIEPVEVVNFYNPYRPRRTPASSAIRNATRLEEKPDLRCPSLADLVALKLYTHARKDEADVVTLLERNPDADFEHVRATAKGYGFDRIDTLIEEAQEMIRRSGS
jgi:hypothetical protein